MPPINIEAIIRQQAKGAAEEIRRAADNCPADEANFRRPVEKLLEEFARQAQIQSQPRHEYTLYDGRADSVYNRLVIEYEPPGSLRPSNGFRTNKHAIDQVKGYIEGLHRRERHGKERVAGIVLDGHWFIFIRFKDDRFHVDDPLPVAEDSTERFLRHISALSTELALTPENLIRDFGETSRIVRGCVSQLYEALDSSQVPKVGVLFDQWSRQFSEICGYQPGSSKLNIDKFAKVYGVKAKTVDPLKLFFVIHTYYATFIKLLAVQIASYYAFPKLGTGLHQVANFDSDRLREYLRKMERGGVFKDFGINNFLEGDFFVWYLDVWDEAMDDAVRQIIRQLADYSLVTLDVDPDETRDLLKRLYQNLMPKALRHALGEYYTPDWLAERLLNQLGYTASLRDLPSKRILDPACGSGTFLVLAIKRLRQWAVAQKTPVDEAELLEKVLGNVVGFDLNPLAVISARTNYLLALGDLLQHRKGDVDIPVYLADSILTPSINSDANGQMCLGDAPALSFKTAVGTFSVPTALVDARYIDQLSTLLEECVATHNSSAEFQRRLLHTFPLDMKKDAEAVEVASSLFDRLAELDRQEVNGIWARIIKNAFAPLFCRKFDFVAGNPPWVNWESLPDEYRQSTARLWTSHNLFSHKGFEAILGKSKDDISVLMTYVALDKYVRDEGRLGFLITQSVFKTAGGGQGFRRFELGDGTPLGVTAVDDMSDLKPFGGASNRTAAVVIQRGRKTKYPVQYSSWYKPAGGSVIPEHLTLDEITKEKVATYRQFVAKPVDGGDRSSPWITGRTRALNAVIKVLGASDYVAKAGICTWLNGVYWLQEVGRRPDGLLVVTNITEGAKRGVKDVQAPIERDLVYPLLRGRDVRRWKAVPSGLILVTHEPGMKLKAIPEDDVAVRLPKTYFYLKCFEEELRDRSGFRRYFKESDPFYSVFNVGDYTFARHKLVWREQAAGLTCAVVGPVENRPTMPDHKLMMVDFRSSDEAHFVCAALNTTPAQFIVHSYGVTIQMDTHVLENVRVPSYSHDNPTHRHLAALSKRAHAAVAAGDSAERVGKIEAEIDALTAKLWGLTDAELEEIQESLSELRGGEP